MKGECAPVSRRLRPRSRPTRPPRRAQRPAPPPTAPSDADAWSGSAPLDHPAAATHRRPLATAAFDPSRGGMNEPACFQRDAAEIGWSFTTAARTSVIVSPRNSWSPVSISKSTQPNAQTSLRLSAARPLACSGLI